jgi:hypothetical protein
LDNLVLLCGFHHRLLHEGGFEMSFGADDATPRFFTPDRTEISPVPEAQAVSFPPRALAPIDDPDVNLCRWDGEPVDYDEAVDAMCAASARG